MAKRKVNKSDEIRKVAAAGLTSPKDIVAKLAAGPKKLKVSPALVSNVLGAKKKKGKGKRRGRKPGKATNGHAVDVRALLAAKTLVSVAGEQGALEVLAVLKKLS